jgi:hypothetical protein
MDTSGLFSDPPTPPAPAPRDAASEPVSNPVFSDSPRATDPTDSASR